MSTDLSARRSDFPELSQTIHGFPICFLDTGASSLQPRSVLTAMTQYYETTHANVHRGVYETAEHATALYEGARVKVGRFLHAPHPSAEIIFTKNTTESMNLFAASYAKAHLKKGDVVVLSEMEHHSNLLPWILASQNHDLELRYIGIDGDGRLDLSNLDQLLKGAKVLSITGMSNVLGTINPIKELAQAAHRNGAIIVVDGAQSVPHMSVDVADFEIDALAFSSHKTHGPTGIGVLWARQEILESLPPFLVGGGMILDVRLDGFLPAESPQRFEAGTPPIAEAVGLGAAIDYLNEVTMEAVREHEIALNEYTLSRLSERFGKDLVVFGPPAGSDRGGVFSFAYKEIHAHDMAQVLDRYGVCVRPGHHCAKPLMRRLGVSATARASLGLYNTEEDIDRLIDAIGHADEIFG